ncbi:MAG: nucleotidyltransferase domain-containing protein [Nanoarchaeota archaeon]
MIIEQNSELKVMRMLVRFWYRKFSAYEIAKESDVSVPMVYNIIEKFKEKGIVKQEDKKIRITFDNDFSYSFKVLYDSERMLDLSKEYQNKIKQVFNVFNSEYKENLVAFMVFGSVASNEQTENSDIDMIVIVKNKKEIDYRKRGLVSLGKLNIIEKEQTEFEEDYFLANDLVLNVLMNGLIIFDRGIIRFLLNKSLPSPSYEVIMQKKERLDVLKNRLFVLLKEKNNKELVEQLRKFIIEKARILLLEKGIIPSSKKYIIDNINKVDKDLYRDYNALSEKNVEEILEKNV